MIAESSEQRDQRHAQDRKIVAIDPLEQLHSGTLHPEDADAISHLGPFGVEISLDEFIRQGSNMQVRRIDMRPADRAIVDQSNGARQMHLLSGEESEVLGRILA